MEFNDLNAMPISDLFIAKQSQMEKIQWKLFDAYKLNYGYDIEITENGMIGSMENCDKLRVIDAKFSSVRRQNLMGVNVTCGLVVFYLDDFFVKESSICIYFSLPKVAYPEKFTYFDDPTNTHVDIFTKATINLGRNLRENLNIRFSNIFINDKNQIKLRFYLSKMFFFSCHMRQTDSYGWPKNGTFDGAVGLFQQKKIQMMIHGTNMRAERLEFTEFAGDIFTPR